MKHSKTSLPATVLIPILGSEVAPRFDLSTEVWIGRVNSDGTIREEEILVLPHPSAEDMCQLILNQHAEVVICGGIETEYFDYLQWKSITVFDSVVAPYARALEALVKGKLCYGFIDLTAEQAGTET